MRGKWKYFFESFQFVLRSEMKFAPHHRSWRRMFAHSGKKTSLLGNGSTNKKTLRFESRASNGKFPFMEKNPLEISFLFSLLWGKIHIFFFALPSKYYKITLSISAKSMNDGREWLTEERKATLKRRKLWFIHHKYGFDNFFFASRRETENGKKKVFLPFFLWFSFRRCWVLVIFLFLLFVSSSEKFVGYTMDVQRCLLVGEKVRFFFEYLRIFFGDGVRWPFVAIAWVAKLFIDGIFNEHLSSVTSLLPMLESYQVESR